jgi:hypothetical protein
MRLRRFVLKRRGFSTGKPAYAKQHTQKYVLSAAQFAALNQVKSQTVRARLSLTGSYFGIRPLKLANGRTAWPDMQVTK